MRGIQPKGPEFDYYGQAQQAAADGIGVAIGVRPYIDDDLAAGRLVDAVRPVGAEGRRLVSGVSRSREDEPAFMAFRDWIVRAAAGRKKK